MNVLSLPRSHHASTPKKPLLRPSRANLSVVRRITLNRVIALTAALCIPLSIILSLQEQLAPHILLWLIATLAYAAAAVTFRKRLKYIQAAWSLVILLMLIGIIAILYAGLLGGVLALAIGVPSVVHTLLMPGRNTSLMLVLSLLISTAAAWYSMQLPDSASLDQLLTSPITWVQSSLAGALLCLIPLTFIWQLLATLHASLGRIRIANHEAQKHIREQERLHQELELRASHDSLTGLWNRGQFMTAAAQEVSQAERYGSALTLLLLDIDFFKQINDQHGHAAGDQALCAFAQACRPCLREIDQLGRIGGEEFAILLPHTCASTALKIADSIRCKIAGYDIAIDCGKQLRMTVSIGIAVHEPGESLHDLLNHADRALYASKRRQRNCCTVADQRHYP